jgi:alkyl hydroperoxide reductase subunit F
MDFNLSTVSFISEKNLTPIDLNRVYDVIIIGGGPAGLTAAVYCMRKGISTAIIIRSIGGQMADTASVENYMGYKYINGIELVDKFREQVLQFSIGYDEGHDVRAIEDGSVKAVWLDDGRKVMGRTVIIASGKTWRKLNVPGEQKLTGRGVAYCTVCDAPLFAGKRVVVAGGGNSAAESAIDLAGIAKSITIVQNLERLTADKILIGKLNTFSNIEYIFNSLVTSINGEERVRSITIKNINNEKVKEIETEGIFVEIGLDPNSGFAEGIIERNTAGEIVVDSKCATNCSGIFAAGDVTSVPFKQIIIAGGEGAKAALSACEYIMMNE